MAPATTAAAAGFTVTKAFVAGISICAAAIGGMWGVIEIHGQHPHKDAVPRTEMEMLRDIMSTEHRSLATELEAIRRELEE